MKKLLAVIVAAVVSWVATAEAAITVSPSSGPLVGGNTVRVSGETWDTFYSAYVGGVLGDIHAQGVDWVDIIMPARAEGSVNIELIGNDRFTLTDAYTYNPTGFIFNDGITEPYLMLNERDGSDAARFDGEGVEDRSASSVSDAGDVNGDGYADFIVGAPLADAGGPENRGVSYVVFGKSEEFDPSFSLGSLDGANGFRIEGLSEDDESGCSVSSAGDVNGDGFADIIIGARNAEAGGKVQAGSCYVIFGKSANFSSTILLGALDERAGFRIDGASSYGQFGNSVSGAGDVNGDGFEDLVVGAARGEAYVIFGKNGGFGASFSVLDLIGVNGFKLDGIHDHLVNVSGAGDVNGDGLDDLILGEPNATVDGNLNLGSCFVVFGKNGGFSSLISMDSLDGDNGFRLNGISAFDNTGSSVSGAGDVNDDGFDDFIIGAYNANSGAGAAYVIFGKSGGYPSLLWLSNLNGSTGFRLDGTTGSNNHSGRSVSGVGDVNDDGIDDLLVGAPGSNAPGGSSSGSCYVLFGKRGGFTSSFSLDALDGEIGYRIVGEATADESGYSVSGAGDVNGDGVADILTGAWFASHSGSARSGSSYLVFGTLAGVVPNHGETVGGYQVTINGENLGNGTDITNVTLNGVSVTSIDSQTPNRVVVTVAPGPVGIGDVVVYSESHGNTTKTNAFEYTLSGQVIYFPAIQTQEVNNTLDLFGTASSGLPVTFSVASGPAVLGDGNKLSFTGVGQVQVSASQTGDVKWSAAPVVTQAFDVIGVVTNVAPDNGRFAGGAEVVIDGQWIGNGTDITNVTICGVPAEIVSQDEHSVTVTTGAIEPQVKTTGDIVVQSAGLGTVVAEDAFTYRLLQPQPPVALSAVDVTADHFTARWEGTDESATHYFLDVSETASFYRFVDGYNNRNVGSANASVVTGLVDGVSYYYRVRAANLGGSSDNSNLIEVPVGDNTPYPRYEDTEGVVSAGASDEVDLTDFFHGAGLVYEVVSNSNPSLVNATIADGELDLDYADDQTGTAEITVRATDPETGFWVEETITLTVVPEPTLSAGPAVLNPETGLYEQVVTVTNSSPDLAADAVTLTVTNLADGASLANGTGTNDDGNPEIYSEETVSPLGSKDFTVEYENPPNSVPEASLSLGLGEPRVSEQVINLSAITDQPVTNTVVLSASASSGLPVSFSVGAGPAVITDGNNLSFSDVGRVEIIASQSGDSDWNAALSVTNSFDVIGVITNVAPNNGSLLGGTEVVIDGISLGDGTDITNVTICGVAAEIISQTGDSVTVITAAIEPQEKTTGDIVVQSEGSGTMVLDDGFTYHFPPLAPLAISAVYITAEDFVARWEGTDETVTHYYLDVSESADFSSFVGGYSNWNVGNVTAAAVTGLVDGVTYYYRVRAANEDMFSSNSNIIEVPVSNNTPYVLHQELSGVASANSSDTLHLDDLFYGVGMNYAVVSNSNESLVAASIAGDEVLLDYTPDETGVASITVRATDPATGYWVDNVITVNVVPEPTQGDSLGLNAVGWVQTVTVTNTSPYFSADAVTLTVTNLADAAIVSNATRVDMDGNPEIFWRGTIPPLGTMSFTVEYEAQPDSFPVASLSLILDERQRLDSAIVFPAIETQVVTNTVGLSASASSSLPVEFSVGSGPAVITDGTNLTFSGAGRVEIVAHQFGDIQWSSALNVTNSFDVIGVITNVAPDSGSVYGGAEVVIDGLWIGNGMDITDVTICGVSAEVVSQGIHGVTVTLGAIDPPVQTNGSIVVTSAEFGEVALDDAFTYYFPPFVPEALSAVDVTTNRFVARWEGWDSITTHYYLDVSESDDFSSFVGIYDNLNMGDSSVAAVTGLVDGVTYYYRVRAANQDATSPSSNIIEVPVSDNTPYILHQETNGVASAGSSDEIPLTDLFHGTGLVYEVVSNSNPSLVAAAIVDDELVLDYADDVTGTASITVRATDPSTGFWVDNVITVTVVPEPDIVEGPVVYNPDTGLYEQVITVTNSSPDLSADAVTLTVTNLADGASLYNATGTDNDGNPEVYWEGTIPPLGSREFILQYETNPPGTDPLPGVAVSLSMQEPEEGGLFGGPVVLAGEVLDENGTSPYQIDFNAAPGRTYFVLYTDSLFNEWIKVLPGIFAESDHIRWVDTGPPDTVSHPDEVRKRFYRIIESAE
ncbi:IPT/TIG domain-containing protein [Verrucomicrobiota bacterium]